LKPLEKILMTAVILLLLFIFWIGFARFREMHVSFLNIIALHTSIIVWITDLLIIGLPLTIVAAINLVRQNGVKYTHRIEELNERIEQNIEFANELREGRWESLETQRADVLSKSLFDLGSDIRNSKVKDDEMNWITNGRAQLSDILRTSLNLNDLSFNVVRSIVEYTGAVQGAFYLAENDGKMMKRSAMFAYGRRRFEYNEIPLGKGLVGAVAYEKEMIFRSEIPDDYFTITSGLLGEQRPKSILIVPLLQENNLQGVLEVAFMRRRLPDYMLTYAEEAGSIIGQTIYSLRITTRTQQLLEESQQLTSTLKKNEEKLRKSAAEMIEAQDELERSNRMLEENMREVEHSQKRLEELLTNASEFISIYNERQELIFESPSVKRILGYADDDEITGMDPEYLTPKGLKTINNLFRYLLETPGGQEQAQYTYIKKSGEKMFLETKGKNLLHDPAIRGIILNTQDITERIRAEKEERMKSRMQSLSENSPDMIIRINLLGRIVYANPAVSNYIDLSVQDVLKKRITELNIDSRFVEFIKETVNDIKEYNQQVIWEVPIDSQHGEHIMEVKCIPEFGEDAELESILIVSHDMTEIKRIEAEIKEKNKKISDSINYAHRIQSSILPDGEYIQQYFPRSFMFYRPKDVVSGDFPWFRKIDEVYYVAAVDCTGHGVPGALISFIGHFLLNNIVNISDNNFTPAEILDRLHQDVRVTLRQDQEGATGRDGMDLALCKITPEKQIIEFAGAHRPLYYLRNGELTEYAASRKAIGGIPLAKKVEKGFENNVIEYEKGDKFFIFSDGMPDQLGGTDRKKYQAKRIRETLTENGSESMAFFAKYFAKDFYDWMGEEKQVDDVLLIGVEL
jgi:PAS domain S-box-containing protein